MRKAHSRHALPCPAALKQRSFPAMYSPVKPKPAKATGIEEKRIKRVSRTQRKRKLQKDRGRGLDMEQSFLKKVEGLSHAYSPKEEPGDKNTLIYIIVRYFICPSAPLCAFAVLPGCLLMKMHPPLRHNRP